MQMLAIPLDLPGHSFTDQLRRLARWAELDPAQRLAQSEAIGAAFTSGHGSRAVAEVMLATCPSLWPWPAYDAFVNQCFEHKLATEAVDEDEEPLSLDDARIHNNEVLKDRAMHLAQKLLAWHYAKRRQAQIAGLKQLRPFWQWAVSDLADAAPKTVCHAFVENRQTYLAEDPFWDTQDTPWNCTRFCSACRVDSLSRHEMQEYAQSPAGQKDLKAQRALQLLKT